MDEEAGMINTVEKVEKVEKMKVTTYLNPLHTTLALFGCLLNYNTIADEMRDPCLKKSVEKIGYDEGLTMEENFLLTNDTAVTLYHV